MVHDDIMESKSNIVGFAEESLGDERDIVEESGSIKEKESFKNYKQIERQTP